jgi:uncharacterized membrane protein
MTIKGAMIAATVAGMFAAASPRIASAGDAKDKAASPAKGAGGQVECEGVNSCKGTDSCHGAGHACAGQNGCKGKGHMKMSKDECLKKGGKVAAEKK